MGQKSNIQWTDATWNVARGCRKVDADCKFCYMYRDGERFKYDAKTVTKTKTVFTLPLKYAKTKSEVWDGQPLLFTSSLTDFFIEEIDEFRNECWDIIRQCPHLTFQILTKRPERIKQCLPPDWGDGWKNVWLGTSVGSQNGIGRVSQLFHATGFDPIRFVSIEPMHEYVDLMELTTAHNFKLVGLPLISTLSWVIVGGESGNETGRFRYRPAKIEWFEKIIDICKVHGVPVFVKQLGTHLAKELGMKDHHGGDINEFPEHLQIREFPRIQSQGGAVG